MIVLDDKKGPWSGLEMGRMMYAPATRPLSLIPPLLGSAGPKNAI